MLRGSIRSRAALGALLVTVAAPALAQYGASQPPPPPAASGSSSGQSPAPSQAAAPQTPQTEVIRAAACVVGENATAAVALLNTAPRSSEERTQAAALLRTAQRCLRLREPLATNAFGLRAAFAEALYETQFATPAAARTPAAGAAPLPRPADAADQLAVALAPMYALADCSAPRHPDLVRALLATDPRTPEENAAFQPLHPAFQSCVPAGTPQLSYDPRFTRGFLAEALYRWSVVQRDGPASPWAAAAPAAAAGAAPPPPAQPH
jgi:hypothetical protein